MRRHLFRDLVTYGTLVAGLVLLLGVAWVSRHPDAPIIESAEDWPLVGGWARSFRDRYVPRQPTPESELAGLEDSAEVPPGHEPFEPDVEAFRASIGEEPPLGSEPEPPGPLPGRPADPARLESALALFSQGYVKLRLGPYSLYTDYENEVLFDRLGRLGSGLEESYRSRFGVEPIGESAESLLLFRSEQDFRTSQLAMDRIRLLESEGYTGFGLAATYVGDRRSAEVVTTLIHELAHLLNRRALGPALPPWLDEGMADDLSYSLIDSSGRLLPGTISGLRIETAGGFELRGGLASLQIAAEGDEQRSLAGLLGLSWTEFAVAGPVGRNYARAAFLVRCLLADRCGPASSAAFREYLVGVSEGRSAEPEELRAELDRSWARVEEDLRRYVRELAQAHGLVPSLSPLE